ncbi:hypothetical protein E4T44_11970 [Aureobasidium sp. EXF-8845]|nr:hypothetical protein E4T45_11799 [Aureobasidium sp. EXF-8846]KAI4798421.1 hypothetical protein E4T44_11970 [Aureobasidium sp. EXF-8845]
MPPRLFERLTAAFWGYVLPQPHAAKRRTAATRNAQPSRLSPTTFVTPPRPGSGYLPLTPADTNAGSKRKRGHEVQDYTKRSRHEAGLERKREAEEILREDLILERLANPDGVDYNAGDLFSEQISEFGSEDGYEDEEVGDEDDGIHYDYNVYNPTIRSDRPLPGQRTLLEGALPRHVRVPQIIIESTEGRSHDFEEETDDDVINVLPPTSPPVYGNGDEDLIVFNDTDADDDEAPEIDHSQDSSSLLLTTSYKEPSLFGSFLEEAQDGEDTILLDSRARVGSLEDERVTKDQLLARGWPANTIPLIQRIHNRGREPVFAFHWRMDFPMMPEGMFLPPEHPHPGYIYEVGKSEFRAKHAFERLMQLGPKVRDKITVGLAPETLIVKELRAYMAWADWDSMNQFPHYPFVEIYAGTRDEDVNAMQDTLLLRLSQLHNRWKNAPNDADAPKRPPPWLGNRRRDDDDDPPPLYGILVSHTLIGLVAFMPGAEDSDSIGYLRTVGVFDFNVVGYDVWTALALALLVVYVRNEAVKRGCPALRDGMRDRWPRSWVDESRDPDR